MRSLAPLLAIALVLAAGAARADGFEYLQIEANEGGSSGGHAAVRLGDRIYHFQNRRGLLLLAHDAPLRFIHDYAGLDNRPIHVLAISVSPDTRRRLERAFEERFQAQRAQLDERDALDQEVALLTALLRRAHGAPPRAGDAVAVAGLGYFSDGGGDGKSPEEASLAALRRRLLALHGGDFFERRIAALRDQLAAMPPLPSEDPEPPSDAYDFPRLRDGYGRRYVDAISGIAALQVLRDARPLRAGTFRALPPGTLPLDSGRRKQLRRLAQLLDAGLERLADSGRPAWGTSLLIGMARRAALERSLASGRLVFLDAYPDAAPRLPARELQGEEDLLAQAAVEADATLHRAATAFFAAARPDERFYSDLEDAANRRLELLAAREQGAALRLDPDRLVPRRAAAWRDLPLPRVDGDTLAHALAESRQRLRHYDRDLEQLYGYQLVTRNCVSELFATLYHGLGNRKEEIRARLGGLVEPGRSLAFIPFVSREAVREHFRVVAVQEIPSYRQAMLARLRERDGELRVALRESNTLTARSYRRNSRDSFFLLFADGPLPLRPLAGIVNLAAGVARTATGLLTLPFDQGRGLLSGAEGALLSLPEITFVDIRKGTNPFVSTREARALSHSAPEIAASPAH